MVPVDNFFIHAQQDLDFSVRIPNGPEQRPLIINYFVDIIANMKTIAMTIDEGTLARIDRLTANDATWKSRSEVIRRAVHRFMAELERVDEEAHEREVFRQNAALLDRQAAALIEEQAKP